MWLKHKMHRLLVEESGQTTTEYILILVLVVTLVMQFRTRLLTIVKKLLNSMEEDVMEVANDESGL
jgi:Flp pilus assembly pilin Flp